MGLGFAVLFVSLLHFFLVVCDPKFILQIPGTFQETCQKLHCKTEVADNAMNELLSKLSDHEFFEEMENIDVNNNTAVIWLHQWKLLSGISRTIQHIILKYLLPTKKYMLLLYFGSREIEVDPLLVKMQHILTVLWQWITHLRKGL